MHVLALNSGSSSLKFGLYRAGPAGPVRLLSGEAQSLGKPQGAFHALDERGASLARETMPMCSHADAIKRVGVLLSDAKLPAPDAIGHRVVHGGMALRDHCGVDARVLHALDTATAFAPLHMPATLAGIRYAQAHFPGLPQVACFDTTFHKAMPDMARTLPLPAELRASGIERYGFHGLSCESIVRQLASGPGSRVPHRLVIAHLGNGASITAVRDGISIDTSMGFTPSGGVIMGTRSGDLDPGVLGYLVRERNFNAAALDDLVDHSSGLLGISGLSGDMRQLHAAAPTNADAALAIRMFCQSVRKQIGAMSVVLDGLDMIVFTGGIGENDATVRADICSGLSSVGVGADLEGDHAGAHCQVRVLPSLEDEQIALHTSALC